MTRKFDKLARKKSRGSRPGKVWTPALDENGKPRVSGYTELYTDGRNHFAVLFNFPVQKPLYTKGTLLTLKDGPMIEISIAPATVDLPFWYRIKYLPDGAIDWLTEDDLTARLA